MKTTSLLFIAACAALIAFGAGEFRAPVGFAAAPAAPVAALDEFAAKTLQHNLSIAFSIREAAAAGRFDIGLKANAADPKIISVLVTGSDHDVGFVNSQMRRLFAGSFLVGMANTNHPADQIFAFYSPFYDSIAAIKLNIAAEVTEIAFFPAVRLFNPEANLETERDWFSPPPEQTWGEWLPARIREVGLKARDYYQSTPAAPVSIAPKGKLSDKNLGDATVVIGRVITAWQAWGTLVEVPKWKKQQDLFASVGYYLASGDMSAATALGVAIPPEVDAIMRKWPSEKRASLLPIGALNLDTGFFVVMQSPSVPYAMILVAISKDDSPKLLFLAPIILYDASKVPEYKR